MREDGESAAGQGLVVKVCLGLSCGQSGGRDILAAVSKGLGLKPGEAQADGCVMLKEGFCFGRCAIGPNAKVGPELISGIDPGDVSRVLKQVGMSA